MVLCASCFAFDEFCVFAADAYEVQDEDDASKKIFLPAARGVHPQYRFAIPLVF